MKYGTKSSANLGESIRTGASMENEKFKNGLAIPNQHDNNAKLFGELSESFGARPGDRPRGLLNNAAAGLFKGLEHGQKAKSIEKSEGKRDKYEEVMNYLQETNNDAIQQNQWYEKRESARKQMIPQVLSYIDNIERLDPQSQRIMAQDILGQYGESLGEDFKLSSIDGSNPFLMTIQSSKGQQLFDLRTLFAGDEAAEQAIAMKMPEYQMKLQEERQEKQRKFQIEEEKMALMRESMSEKNSVQREKLEQTTRRNDQNAMKSDIKLNETLGKKIDASREFLTIAPKMEKIVRDHPDIFQSAIDATWRENDEPGYVNNFIKTVQDTWNPEKVAALTAMTKYINKMTLDVANGFSRPNMFIEKIGSKAVPNLDMSPQAFSEVLHEMVDEKRKDIENNQRRMKLFEQQEGKPLSQDYANSTQDVMGQSEAPWASIWKEAP